MKVPRPPGSSIDKKRMAKWKNEFTAYRSSVTEFSISSWLDQFKVQERDTAARVLDAVEFYGDERIASAYRKGLEAIPGWSSTPSERTGRWRFAPFSRAPGESGDAMMHRFRMANRLTGKAHDAMFKYASELMGEKLGPDDTVILVDDFVATGDSVCSKWADGFEEAVGEAGAVFLVLVAAVSSAQKRIMKETGLTVRAAHDLGKADNLFEDSCRHFKPAEKECLLRYGTIADKKRPKGYGDCGLVVVFQHRCPNNSLPILHAEHKKWTALFPRNS